MPRWLLLRQVGVAFADAAGRRLGACEFTDDENFCNLEAVTTQLGAKECVIPKVRFKHEGNC
jgi:DNA mismatch repair protein MSH2